MLTVWVANDLSGEKIEVYVRWDFARNGDVIVPVGESPLL